MGKSMRDLDKIQEDYEFHLDSRQVRRLIVALSTISLLIFVLGFLVGQYFPRPMPSREYASTETTPSNGAGIGTAGEESSRGFKFDFFDELSNKGPAGEAGKEPLQKKSEGKADQGVLAPEVASPPSQTISSDQTPEEAGHPEEVETPEDSASSSVQPPVTLPSAYTVQVGAFADLDGAKGLAEKLKRENFPSYILDKTVRGKGTWHRVRVGRYAKRAEAERVAKVLEEREGLTTFITLYANN